MHSELVLLGLVVMSAPWIARLVGYETNQKPFDLVGVAGIFILLSAGLEFGVTLFPALESLGRVLLGLSFSLGILGLVVGAVWGTIDVLREPSHSTLRPEHRA